MSGDQAPKVSVEEVRLYEWPFKLRLPFRFGAITVTHGRQLVLRARIRAADGKEAWGVAAECLAAKWFDKSPELSDEQNLEQLRLSVESAVDLYRKAGARTAFGLFAATYREQLAEGARHRLPPIVAGFGPALLDRAVLDALGRSTGQSFYAMMGANIAGMAGGDIVPDLAGFDFDGFLGSLRPAKTIHARHTVGMVDPIVAADQSAAQRVNDGLPETLEEVVRDYRGRYYKLKVGGNVEQDVARLARIAAVLDRMQEPYHASLDGNEQYQDAAGVLALWNAIKATPVLARLAASILFIEQPIKRAVAFEQPIAALDAEKAVIIDESDGDLDAFPRARALGYRGVSSKTCKGLYKSLINAARCRLWNSESAGARWFMSAEDLTTLAGVSVQQDLALVNLIGLTHVERNGHHFVDGFFGRTAKERDGFLAAHPDLYHRAGDQVRLTIKDGLIALGSLGGPGYAVAAEPDFSALEAMPKSRWSY